MKKTITIALLMLATTLTAQTNLTTASFTTTANIGGSTTRNNVPGWLSANNVFSVPRVDTTRARATSFPGAITFRTTDSKLYVSNGLSWVNIIEDLNIAAPLNYNSTTRTVSLDTSVAIISRLTKTQRNALVNPTSGTMIYQTDNTPGLRVFKATDGWVRFTETQDP